MKTFFLFCHLSATVLCLSFLFLNGTFLSAQQGTPAKKEGANPPAGANNSPNQSDVEETQPLARYTAWKIEDLSEKKAEIINAFKGGTANPADRDTFLDNYYFARWTDPAQMGQVQTFSKDFIQDLRDSTGNAREFFLRKSFETLQKMVADANVTPTARYNAILAIGNLVQREPSNRNDPPTAYAPALPYLIAEYEKENNPEYLRLGALVGIVRHTAMGIADAEMKNSTVPNLLMKIITSGKPTADRDQDDQELLNWFRLRALEGLAELKSVGPDAKVVKTLFGVIENTQESINMQVHAARVFGELDWKAAADANIPIEYQALGSQLISLSKRVVDAEVQIIDDLLAKEKVGSSGGISGYSGGGMGMSDYSSMPSTIGGPLGAAKVRKKFEDWGPEQQLETRAAVERLKMELYNVNYGIRGMRFTGTATIGIITQLPNDDPVAKKLTSTCREMFKLYRMLEEGPQEESTTTKKATSRGSSSSSSSSSPMDEMMMSSSGSGLGTAGRAPAALPKDTKPLKVTLDDIQEELKRLSTALEGIISGGS